MTPYRESKLIHYLGWRVATIMRKATTAIIARGLPPTFCDSAPASRDMRLIKHQKKPSREQSFMITEQERLSLNLSEIPLAMSFIYLCSFEQQ